MTSSQVLLPSRLAATAAWSRRVRRIGGLIQLAFATFWLVRGALTVGGGIGAALIGATSVLAVAVAAYGLRAGAGVAPAPTGPEARRLGWAVTVCTVVQLAASFVVPVGLIAAGRPAWVLPSIAVTIGLQLLWLGRRLAVPRYLLVGAALTGGPVLAAVVLSGGALAATVGIGSGTLLLGTAAAGFHDLARLPRPAPAG